MVDNEQESRSALRTGKLSLPILPEPDGEITPADSALMCAVFEESVVAVGPPPRCRLYAIDMTFEAVT